MSSQHKLIVRFSVWRQPGAREWFLPRSAEISIPLWKQFLPEADIVFVTPCPDEFKSISGMVEFRVPPRNTIFDKLHRSALAGGHWKTHWWKLDPPRIDYNAFELYSDVDIFPVKRAESILAWVDSGKDFFVYRRDPIGPASASKSIYGCFEKMVEHDEIISGFMGFGPHVELDERALRVVPEKYLLPHKSEGGYYGMLGDDAITRGVAFEPRRDMMHFCMGGRPRSSPADLSDLKRVEFIHTRHPERAINCLKILGMR